MIITANEITMRIPDNWHAHFRQNHLLRFLVPVFIHCGWRGRIIAEPNTLPPQLTGQQAVRYGQEITAAAIHLPSASTFTPVVTIQITESTTPEIISEAFAQGVRVCKVYPRYVTTHSENGVVDYDRIYPALNAAQKHGMIVQFHGEHPSYTVIGRLKESAFRSILDRIRQTFPHLKISVEHVSSLDMVEWVKAQPAQVGASVTIHHLYQTADDLNGYSQRSGGLVCVDDGAFKPGAKDPEDRQALRDVVLSGHPQFWYGGDDAAHLKSKKHASRCACGAWNTLAALPLLIQLFTEHRALPRLEPFLSEHGAQFYGYPLNEGFINFRREPWTIPQEVIVPELNDSLVPFYAGERVAWKII